MTTPQYVITDAELHHAHTILKRYPSGLSRADLARYFQSDRKGRDLMAALAERGIAPVVNVPSDYSDQRVYRLARNEQEVHEATGQGSRHTPAPHRPASRPAPRDMPHAHRG